MQNYQGKQETLKNGFNLQLTEFKVPLTLALKSPLSKEFFNLKSRR